MYPGKSSPGDITIWGTAQLILAVDSGLGCCYKDALG